jgi:hypothetical protein
VKSLFDIFTDTVTTMNPQPSSSRRQIVIPGEERFNIYVAFFEQAKAEGYTRESCASFKYTLIKESINEGYKDKKKLEGWKKFCEDDAKNALIKVFKEEVSIKVEEIEVREERKPLKIVENPNSMDNDVNCKELIEKCKCKPPKELIDKEICKFLEINIDDF